MNRLKTFLLSGFVLMLVFAMSSAFAQQAGGKNLDQAIRSVEKRTGGQVLSADTRRSNGQLKHRIKIITPSGKVRIIFVDAR